MNTSNKWKIKLGGKIYTSSELNKIKQFLEKLKKENNLPEEVTLLSPDKENWVSLKEASEFKYLFTAEEKDSLELAGVEPEGLAPVSEQEEVAPVPDAKPDKIKCPQCGYENTDDATYCGMCSEPFNKDKPDEKKPEVKREIEQKTEEPAEVNQPSAASKKPVKLMPIIILAVFLIIGYQLFKRSGGGSGGISGKKTSSEIKFENNINELIQSGEDLNEALDDGRPLLLWAVTWNYFDSMRLLLENGVDPDTTPGKRATWSVLFEAIQEKGFSNAEVRLAKTRETAKILLEYGADVNYVNPVGVGETPLYKAASRGRNDLCELFIEKGANINMEDKLGQTPLMIAAEGGYWEIVQMFLDSGADANSTNKLGETALDIAKKRPEEAFNKDMRKKDKEYHSGSDYDKTIEILSQ